MRVKTTWNCKNVLACIFKPFILFRFGDNGLRGLLCLAEWTQINSLDQIK